MIATMLTVASLAWMGFENHVGRKEIKMSNKTSTFFPSYTLRSNLDEASPHVLARFYFQGTKFLWKGQLLGMTETQKTVMLRLGHGEYPPVISCSHRRPIEPDQETIRDPNEIHRWYFPYAMAEVTIQFMGETEPRKIKVYFCNGELHEDSDRHVHCRFRETYIVGL